MSTVVLEQQERRRDSTLALVWRSVWGGGTWLALFFFAFYGMPLADPAYDGRASLVPYAWLLLLTWSGIAWRRLGSIHTLPIPRRLLLTVIQWPPLAALVLSWIGFAGVWTMTGQTVVWGELPVLLALIAVPWQFLAAGFYRMCRGDVTEKARTSAYGVVAVTCALAGLVSLQMAKHVDTGAPLRFIDERVVAPAASLPGGTLLLWVAAVVLVVLGYRVAERQFLNVETPVPSRS